MAGRWELCRIAGVGRQLSSCLCTGVHSTPGAEAAWRCQEEEEEVLHHPQEEQTQEEEGQAGCAQVLQGRTSCSVQVLADGYVALRVGQVI